MLVLKRLIAFVVTGVTVIATGGVALAGLGQPSPWELGLQHVGNRRSWTTSPGSTTFCSG